MSECPLCKADPIPKTNPHKWKCGTVESEEIHRKYYQSIACELRVKLATAEQERDTLAARVKELKEKWLRLQERDKLAARSAFDRDDRNLTLLLSGRSEATIQFLADLTAILEAHNG